MRILSNGLTNVGKVRSNNEDSYGIYDDMNLYIVADGMGGHNAGEVASKLTVDTIYTYFKENFKLLKKEDPVNFIKKAVKLANKNVYNRAQKNPDESGMGTTVTLIFIYNRKAYIGWVGDSRVYISRFDEDEGKRLLSQITTDHSLIEEQIANDIITREEAEKYEIKDIITRAVGFNSEVEVDCNVLKELKKDDIFMACSDGYYRYFKPIEIAKTFVKTEFENLAEKMVNQALEKGGEDNITVVTVKIDEI